MTRASRALAPTDDLLRAALLSGASAVHAWQRWTSRAGRGEPTGEVAYLLPLVYVNLSRDGVADATLDRARDLYRRNWARNRTLFREVAVMAARLRESGVRFLLLKGSALVARYYQDPATRVVPDVDVLVPRDQLPLAIGVLASIAAPPRLYGRVVHSVDARFIHSVAFKRPGVSFDLHARALRECTPATEATCWEAAECVHVEGVAMEVPSAADMLVAMCVHGTRPRAEPHLRWHADVAAIVASGRVDWHRVTHFAGVIGVSSIVAAALDTAGAFGVVSPEATRAALRRAGSAAGARVQHAWGDRDNGPVMRMTLSLMELLRNSGPGVVARALAVPAWVRFACQSDSWREVPGAVAMKLARFVGHLLGVYRYPREA